MKKRKPNKRKQAQAALGRGPAKKSPRQRRPVSSAALAIIAAAYASGLAPTHRRIRHDEDT